MAKKNKKSFYSTDPNAFFEWDDESEKAETLSPGDQKLRVWLEKKGRGGKTASVIKGFIGTTEDCKNLCKTIKTKCGCGGSVVDGEIIIQGDQRDKILRILNEQGYTQVKKSGG